MYKKLLFSLLSIFIMGSFSPLSAQKAVQNTSKKNNTDKETMVKIETSKGTMTIKLYNETPLHRDNFIKLAKEGYYNGLLFHRVIKNFMIQGGDPDSKNAEPQKMLGMGGPGYTIPAEFNKTLIHKKGALAAARDNNPQKASSGSQFYIVQGKAYNDSQLDMMASQMGISYTPQQKNIYRTIGGTPFLDMNYTVFGEVVEGLSIIDKIANVTTDRNDRPNEDVKIISMTVVEE